jgi:hypothetical protein
MSDNKDYTEKQKTEIQNKYKEGYINNILESIINIIEGKISRGKINPHEKINDKIRQYSASMRNVPKEDIQEIRSKYPNIIVSTKDFSSFFKELLDLIKKKMPELAVAFFELFNIFADKFNTPSIEY